MKVVRSILERERITSGSSCPSEERVLVVRGSAEDDAGGRSGWLVPSVLRWGFSTTLGRSAGSRNTRH